jgi:hypothetical protein
MFSAIVAQYVEQYAEFHDIPVDHVRTVIDGPDENNVFDVRMDSYEHPHCETETIRLNPDGSVAQ